MDTHYAHHYIPLLHDQPHPAMPCSIAIKGRRVVASGFIREPLYQTVCKIGLAFLEQPLGLPYRIGVRHD